MAYRGSVPTIRACRESNAACSARARRKRLYNRPSWSPTSCNATKTPIRNAGTLTSPAKNRCPTADSPGRLATPLLATVLATALATSLATPCVNLKLQVTFTHLFFNFSFYELISEGGDLFKKRSRQPSGLFHLTDGFFFFKKHPLGALCPSFHPLTHSPSLAVYHSVYPPGRNEQTLSARGPFDSRIF